MQEWTNQHDVARVDIAGVDNAAPCGRGGQCTSGLISTVWQGGTMRSGQCRSRQASKTS